MSNPLSVPGRSLKKIYQVEHFARTSLISCIHSFFFSQNVARIVVFIQVRNGKNINCSETLCVTVVVTLLVLYLML